MRRSPVVPQRESAILPLHRLHDEDVERLLAQGERSEELRAALGASAFRELSSLARRAALQRGRRGVRVYVLPGLMGSRIGSRGQVLDDVLWLDLLEVAAGHLTRLALPQGASLVALGAMWLNVLKLKLSLQIAGYDARLHAYDWRLGVNELAEALANRIVDDGAREVMLVGHSMGALVARIALASHAQSRISRVVQIGAPNSGSFAAVLALRGVYPTVRKIAALDPRHDAEDLARLVFRTLPSLHELLPDPQHAGGLDLFDVAHWPADALRPQPHLLAAAKAARTTWPDADPRCLHIIGVRQDTVTQITRAKEGFEYRLTPDGDGTVTLQSARLPAQRAWYAAEAHGALPNSGRVIAAAIDLLHSGETRRLPSQARRSRHSTARSVAETTLRRIAPRKVDWRTLSAEARRRLLEPVVSPEFHGEVDASVLTGTAAVGLVPQPRPTMRRIELRLLNDSITSASARALVLGVYRNVDPSGAAAAVDHRLGGAIRELTLRRMFAAQLGHVFILPTAHSTLMAEFVLFAGLGEFDDFGAEAQRFAAENAVRSLAHAHTEDFATVLFGAGSGVPVAQAYAQQMQGFLDGLRQASAHGIRRITFCETDRRKYRALCRAARGQVAAAARQGFDLWLDEAVIPAEKSAEKRAQRTTTARRTARGETAHDGSYLLVTLLEASRQEFECRAALLTAGAKAAVLSSTQRVNRRELLDHLALVTDGAPPSARDLRRFGTRLTRLLLGGTVREGLASMAQRGLVVVHDREASRIPWETLCIDDQHPALGHGISRRYVSDALSVARWRETRMVGERLRMLLVVNPTLDLPGAAAEGEALRTALSGADLALTVLEGGAATRQRIVDAIAAGDCDVLHFAGHGHFSSDEPGSSGLICAGGTTLRGSDLDGLGNLPALVFFNACEAARVRRRRGQGHAPAARRDARAARWFGSGSSAGLAETFLTGGVANFLGTHWPVGDAAALSFSTQLYAQLMRGVALGDAILSARRAVAALASSDWADYVHYGNPLFSLRLAPG